MKTVGFELPERPLALTRKIDPHPFVPSAESARRKRCEDILTIQAAGLAARLRHTGCKAVLGLSGGLDSALALLVTCRACDRLNRPRADIRAVTMPCFRYDRTHPAECPPAGAGLRGRAVRGGNR